MEGRGKAVLRLIVAAIALLAVAVPAAVVRYAPRVPVAAHRLAAARLMQHVVPAAELPPVEPIAFVDMTPDEARAYNADVPFSTDANPAARPFHLAETPEDAARATDCLAAALVYEAGADADGQRAVAQVILNRLRHPAFPKTVCGVVFEGSERTTGCQFTFACDGALSRWTPTPDGWRAARVIATAALAGSVYRAVGYATHYHTDWVVPYWQSSLDKVAAVHTHLFFRWSGWWGTPPAFHAPAAEAEPIVAQLAELSDAHRVDALTAGTDPALAAATPIAGVGVGVFVPIAGDANSFLVALPTGVRAETLPIIAAQACGERPQCRFSAWNDPHRVPTALPLQPQQIAAMTFAFIRDRSRGYEKPLWNCQQVARPDPAQCMKVQVFQPDAGPASSTVPVALPTAAAAPSHAPSDLAGVHHGSTAKTADPGTPRAPATPAKTAPAAAVTPSARLPTPPAKATPSPS